MLELTNKIKHALKKHRFSKISSIEWSLKVPKNVPLELNVKK